jgi:hypothetical protein
MSKITINLSDMDKERLASLRQRFPFASMHALVQLLMREGLDAGPDRLVARLDQERAEGLRP